MIKTILVERSLIRTLRLNCPGYTEVKCNEYYTHFTYEVEVNKALTMLKDFPPMAGNFTKQIGEMIEQLKNKEIPTLTWRQSLWVLGLENIRPEEELI